MLTLAGSLRLGDFTVYRDVALVDGTARPTATFYALRGAPRLAREADGGPSLHLLWYRRSAEMAAAGVRGGAVATITLSLAPSVEEREELRTGIARATGIEGAIQVLPLPAKAGTVELSLAGEKVGSAPARLTGDERATFLVELGDEAAALLDAALRGETGAPLLHARWDLLFEHRLADVRLRVWCDARAAREVVKIEGPLDAAKLRARLSDRVACGVELTTESEIAPERLASLEALGRELLEAALPNLLADGAASLDHTFSQAAPVEKHAAVDALLPVAMSEAERAARVRIVDTDGGFFRVLAVQVLCTVDFANEPVAAVKVWLASGDARGELVLRDGASVATWRTDLVSPSERAWRWRAEVIFRDGGEPLVLDWRDAEGTLLALDLDGVGVLRVDVALGDVPLDRVRTVVVDLEYPSRGLAHTLYLDGAHPSETWRALTREVAPGPLRWRAAWLVGDERIEGPWTETHARRLFVGAPPAVAEAEVRVLAAGAFDDLAQLVVDLELLDGSSAAQVTLVRAGEAGTWKPRVADPGATPRYRHRVTAVGTDGERREGAWREEDASVLVVRDAWRFNVEVVPRLLDLGGDWAFGVVHLVYRDEESGLSEEHTLVLRDRATVENWRFRVAAPERHGYRYQLTLVPPGGARRVLPWRDAREEILVLRADDE